MKERVPEHLQPLYEIVGEKNYEEILRFYGGTGIYVPMLSSYNRGQKQSEIIKDYYENGLSVAKIALKWGVSMTTVRNILKKRDNRT